MIGDGQRQRRKKSGGISTRAANILGKGKERFTDGISAKSLRNFPQPNRNDGLCKVVASPVGSV